MERVSNAKQMDSFGGEGAHENRARVANNGRVEAPRRVELQNAMVGSNSWNHGMGE